MLLIVLYHRCHEVVLIRGMSFNTTLIQICRTWALRPSSSSTTESGVALAKERNRRGKMEA